MQRSLEPNESRRRFLKLSGGALVLIPVANLIGCSDKADPPASSPAPVSEPAAAPVTPAAPEQPAQPAAPSQPATAVQLAQIDENDATAKALGYRHATEQVDASKYPRHAAGQQCQNCSLYQANVGDQAGWGGCSIFPGKLVNANGWCSAYVSNT